jgi:hypothetical protein
VQTIKFNSANAKLYISAPRNAERGLLLIFVNVILYKAKAENTEPLLSSMMLRDVYFLNLVILFLLGRLGLKIWAILAI